MFITLIAATLLTLTLRNLDQVDIHVQGTMPAEYDNVSEN